MARRKPQKDDGITTGKDENVLLGTRNRVIDAMGKIASAWGYNEVVGRIYGSMFFSDEPMGLDDIAGRLGISKATVSLNIPMLENLHMIRRIWRKGERRRFYEAERDFARIVGNMISTIISQEVAAVSMTARETMDDLEDIIASTRGQVRKDAEKDKERMENVLDFIQIAEKLMDIVQVVSNPNGGDRSGRGGGARGP